MQDHIIQSRMQDFTLIHISGKMWAKSGPRCVATKTRKFQKAPPPSRRSPMSRTQRATRGQSSVSCCEKHVIRILRPRKATWHKVGRVRILTSPDPWTLSDPLRASALLVTFLEDPVVGRGWGGFSAWKMTVRAKLISDWRIRGASKNVNLHFL